MKINLTNNLKSQKKYTSLGNTYPKLDKNESLGYNAIKNGRDIVCCDMRES